MAVAADALLTAAIQLRDSLQASATLTKQATEQCESVAAQMRALEQGAAALVVRTGSLQQARANIKKAQQRADQVLEHLDASRKYQPVVRAGPHADLGAFLKVVGQLEETVKFLLLLESNRSRTAADALPHAAALRDDAVSQCAAEFALLLRQHAARPPDPPAAPAPAPRMRERGLSLKEGTAAAAAAGPVPSATDLVPEPVLEQLKALAEVLLKSNVRGCIATYVDVRQGVHRKALERHLEQLGREEVARLGWQQLEGRIPGWSAALRLYVRLVQAESKLSAAVFRPSDQAAVLAQVVAPGAASLVDVAGAVFCTKREPEKIFALLEMHAAVEGALPALHAAAAAAGGRLDRTSVAGALARFSPGPQGAPPPPAAQQLGPVQELAALRGKLAAEARTCFKGLQEAVALDAGGAAPADATVHPLCASTVPSLKRILGFETALPVLFGEDARGGPCGGSDTGLAEEARLLGRMTGAVGRVLDALLSGLETRARAAYRSPAQAALAMANNALFLCKSIEGSKELRAVGEGWWEAHKAMADQYAKQYEELATGPLLSVLRADLRHPAPSNVTSDKAARQACKDVWTSINKALADLTAQAAWAVPDAALRYSIKDALAEAVLPLYERVHTKYAKVPFSEQRSKYVRYTPDDITNRLQAMFEGAESAVAMTTAPSVQRSASITRAVSSLRRSTQHASP